MGSMGKRLLTSADRQIIEEAGKLGEEVTSTQLERWRQAGLILRTDRRGLGRGSVSCYPNGTAAQAVTVARLLKSKGNRSLAGAVLPLFLAGNRIREDVLKHTLISSYDETRHFLLEESRRCRRMWNDARSPGRPSQFDVAEGAALAYMAAAPAALRPLLTRMRALSQQNQEADGDDAPPESPESLLVSALSHFFVVFLYGASARDGWEAIPELLYMVGLEQVVRVVLARFGVTVDDDFYVTLETVLPALSLPALKRTVSRASLIELEAMRDDSLSALATAQVFGQALPVIFGERAKALVPLGRPKDEYAMLACLIPAVHNMRHLRAAEAAAETVRELQEQVPEIQAALKALDGPAATDVERRQLRIDVKQAIAEEVRRNEEEGPAARK